MFGKRMAAATVVLALLIGAGLVAPSLGDERVIAQNPAAMQTQAENEAIHKSLESNPGLQQFGQMFRPVVKAVIPAVVEVRVTKKVTMENSGIPEGLEDFFRNLPPNMRPQLPDQGPGGGTRQFVQRGIGSGVIVDAQNGYLLTNNHVVEGEDKVEIHLQDGRKLIAEKILSDPKTDIAVVKIKAENLIAAPLGDSDAMEVGDWVLAVGSPEGLDSTVTAGIVSAKGRHTDRPEQYESFIQTDAAINQGNSGGPLVNMRGEVIGINTAIVTRSGANAGIGLAIPSNIAKRIMKQLIEKGKVVRGFLGVGIKDVDEKLAKSFNLPSTEGSLVEQIGESSPAAKAGMHRGDFVTAVDGKAVKDTETLRNRVANMEPGSTHTFTVIRDGKSQDLKVVVGEQPKEMGGIFQPGGPAEQTPQQQGSAEKLGLTVQTMTPELARKYGYDPKITGAVVVSVRPGSDAAEQGIQAGMLIKQVGKADVESADEFAAAVSKLDLKAGVRLYVQTPDGAGLYVLISPEEGKAKPPAAPPGEGNAPEPEE